MATGEDEGDGGGEAQGDTLEEVEEEEQGDGGAVCAQPVPAPLRWLLHPVQCHLALITGIPSFGLLYLV